MPTNQRDSITTSNAFQTTGPIGSSAATDQFRLIRSEVSGGFQMSVSPSTESKVEPAFGVHIREAARGVRRLFNER